MRRYSSTPSPLQKERQVRPDEPIIDPTADKDERGLFGRFWDWLNRPPETESEKAMMDFGAGFGDSMTFGLSKKVRQLIGTDEFTNYEGDAYKRGQQAEGFTPRGLGGKLALKLGIKRGARKTLKIDPTKPAQEVLPGDLKREFPSQHLDKSLNEIKNLLRQSSGMEKRILQKAKKILEQSDRLLRR